MRELGTFFIGVGLGSMQYTEYSWVVMIILGSAIIVADGFIQLNEMRLVK